MGCAVATGNFPVAIPCGKPPGVPGAATGTGGTGCVPGAGGCSGCGGVPCGQCTHRMLSVQHISRGFVLLACKNQQCMVSCRVGADDQHPQAGEISDWMATRGTRIAKLANNFGCTLPRPLAGEGGTGTECAAALLAAVAEAEEPCTAHSLSVSAIFLSIHIKVGFVQRAHGSGRHAVCSQSKQQVRP
jgi:hypothetical protein